MLSPTALAEPYPSVTFPNVAAYQEPINIHSTTTRIQLKMATRRIATEEKTYLDQDETKAERKSNISPAVPTYANILITDLDIF